MPINEMMGQNNPNIDTNIAKLLVGASLTEEEIASLAELGLDQLAIRAVNITSNQLLSLRDPRIIINAAAVIYGQIANNIEKNGTEKTDNFRNNLARIEEIREKSELQEKGPTK